MASLSDILTTVKNAVTSINQIGQTYLKINGTTRSVTMTTTTLVASGQGRLASVSVIAASGGGGGGGGSGGEGMIYDSNNSASSTNALAVIPTTLGVYVINMPYNNGLVVVPGTGMTVVVSYSGE